MASDELKKGYRRALMISGLFLAYLFLSVVSLQLQNKYAPMDHPLKDQANRLAVIRYTLWGMSVSLFFLIRFLMKIFDKGLRKKNITGKKLVNRFIMGNVMKDAICVAVAIYGNFLFHLGGRSADFYSFLVASLIMLAYFFPRLSDWQERQRSIERPA